MKKIEELSDIQAESGIIGTLIFHPEFVLNCDYLRPEHFFEVNNGAIYWAISELYKDGITNIDAYNLSQKLSSSKKARKKMDESNFPAAAEFTELYKYTARHTIEEYESLCQTVATYAFKRNLIKSLHKIESDCYNNKKSLEDLSNGAYGELEKLTTDFITGKEVKVIGDQVDNLWGTILSKRSANGIFGIPSKYQSLNSFFTYQQGELVLIQARYKQGKSVFLMNEVVHKLKNGVPTLVIDTEMSDELYFKRLISHLSRVPVKAIETGDYSEEDEQKIQAQLEWLKSQPFVHLYEPDITENKIYSICKMLKYKMGLQFFVYDYLKSNEKDTSVNYNVLGQKCDYLKNKIAGELDLAVLSACQLNRAGEVADSDKINRYLSVGVKWEHKKVEQIVTDGQECGDYMLKIYVNRLGEHMEEDDEQAYIDFAFDGNTMTIVEAKQHKIEEEF